MDDWEAAYEELKREYTRLHLECAKLRTALEHAHAALDNYELIVELMQEENEHAF